MKRRLSGQALQPAATQRSGRGSARVRRTAARLLALATLVMGGCATTDPAAVVAEATSRKAAPQVELGDYLDQALQARQAGQVDKSRRLYREAAQSYPAAKEPWLQLAEDHFREGDYGHAILAAQEVLQRDAKNALAHSVLAVSGLRVSAQSLGELRDSSRFELGSRDEAVELTQQLKAHLGEAVLVPARPDASAEPARSAPPVAQRARAPSAAGRPPAPAVATARAGARTAPPASNAAAATPGGAASAAVASPVKPVTSRPVTAAAPARATTPPTTSPSPPPAAAGATARPNPFKVLD